MASLAAFPPAPPDDARNFPLRTLTPSFEARSSPLHGRGLFATKAIPAGTALYRERPLVAMQTLANRADVLVCAACFGPLPAPTETHLGVLVEGVCSPREVASSPRAFGCVGCQANCGELFCSQACHDRAWNVYGHGRLCTGLVPEAEAETHPVVQFKMHAVMTNEIFLLVAAVVVRMVLRQQRETESNGGGSIDGSGAAAAFSDMARAPFMGFVQKPWWEVARDPSASASDTDSAAAGSDFQDSLRSLCDDTAELLRAALFPAKSGSNNSSMGGLAEAVTGRLVGCIVGMFEQNQLGIRRASPLRLWLRSLLDEHAAADGDESSGEDSDGAGGGSGGGSNGGSGGSSSNDDRGPLAGALRATAPLVAAVALAAGGGEYEEEEDEDDEEDEVEGGGGGSGGRGGGGGEEGEHRPSAIALVAGQLQTSDGDFPLGVMVTAIEEALDLENFKDEDEDKDEEGEAQETDTEENAAAVTADKDDDHDDHDIHDHCGDDNCEHRDGDGDGNDQEEVDPLFPPLDGTALYTTTCIMNHACSPNIHVSYVDAPVPPSWFACRGSSSAGAGASAGGSSDVDPDPAVAALDHAAAYTTQHAAATGVRLEQPQQRDGQRRQASNAAQVPIPGVTHHSSSSSSSSSSSVQQEPDGREPSHALEVVVTALRDIAEGEELCFSYIGADMPPHERRSALLEYDIVDCKCERCCALQEGA